jgi:predicted transport protein
MPMFKNKNTKLYPVKELTFKKEKTLQALTEENLGVIFGLQFVSTEYPVEGMYIDTLAYDEENKTFVIIEYKRGSSFSVVDQGFSYLSLMLNRKADFIQAYNEAKNKNLKRDHIDWSQARIIFVAPSFTAHQQNAVNFKNMPFELWEAVQFEEDLIQYRKIEISKSAESLEQMKNIGIETQKVAKEVRNYTEEDVMGKNSTSLELYTQLKEFILQIDPSLKPNPKSKYVSFLLGDNWRNLFYINKLKGGLSIAFTRSKPADFDDPKKMLKYLDTSMESYNQNISILLVSNKNDLRYAILMIQQAYDRFVKEFGS